LKVVGTERVTVTAGNFDSYKLQLTAKAGSGDMSTVWIAKQSRVPVKVSAFDRLYGQIRTEMVP
jgi:hypothetical protein